MHRAPQSVVHRDQLENFRTTAGLMADAQTELMGLRNIATKVPRGRLEASTYRTPLVPGRLDYTLQSFVTRTKRAAKDPVTSIGFERTRSELYPQAPPQHVSVLLGQNSRFVGRDPVVLVP
jgi:hypothetical protein